VVDDQESVLDYYRTIFESPVDEGFEELSAFIYDVDNTPSEVVQLYDFLKPDDTFYVDYATQGEEAVELVKESFRKGESYAAILMDIRMPPGIDGLEASKIIRTFDPSVQIFIITAYSDYSVDEIVGTLNHDVMVLKKPFYNEDLLQFTANALKSWRRMERVIDLKWKICQHSRAVESTPPDSKKQLFTSYTKDFQELEYLTAYNKVSGILRQDQLLDLYFEKIDSRQSFTLLVVTIEGVEKALYQSGISAADHLLALCVEKISHALPREYTLYDLRDGQICIYLPTPLTGEAEKTVFKQIENSLYFIFSPEMLKIHVSASLQLFNLPEDEQAVNDLLQSSFQEAPLGWGALTDEKVCMQ
jgi:CheY-like chemotaxis protein/GGDEF domain-containing protein